MRSWSWLHRVAVPGVVVAVEAAWLSVWLAATTRDGPGGRSHVPFVALALVAVVATTLTGLSARLRWRRRWRLPALLLVAAAGVLLSGFALTSLLDGSLGSWVLHPWSVAGHPPHGEEELAFVLAVLAWGRGVWAAWEEQSARAVVSSTVIAGAAFALFFVVAALAGHDRRFAAATPQAAVLLLVLFPAALAAVALAQESELERWRLRQRAATPSLAWLAAVLVPMLAVAVVALLAGLAGGPLAGAIDTAARAVGAALGAVIEALARLLGSLLRVHAVSRPQVPESPAPLNLGRLRVVKTHTPFWLVAVAIAIAGLVALGVVVLLVRLLRRLLASLRLPERDEGGAEEDADSVFSWSHLLDQMRAALARLLARLRPRRPFGRGDAVPGVAPALAAPVSLIEEASVRAEYRRVLRAARAGGQGRLTCETPRELERRLVAAAQAVLPADAAGGRRALHEITELYDLARYGSEPVAVVGAVAGGGLAPAGDAPPGESELERARRCADVLESFWPAGSVDEEELASEAAVRAVER